MPPSFPSDKFMIGLGKVARQSALVEAGLFDVIARMLPTDDVGAQEFLKETGHAHQVHLLAKLLVWHGLDSRVAEAEVLKKRLIDALEERNSLLHDVLGSSPGADWVYRTPHSTLKNPKPKVFAEDLEKFALDLWDLYYDVTDFWRSCFQRQSVTP